MTFSDTTSRLRMFAGPNGAGKSTIKSVIDKKLLGYYINPDEIEAEIRMSGFLNFDKFGIKPSPKEIFDFFEKSTLLEYAKLTTATENLKFVENRLDFSSVEINSYFASVTADFIRRQLLLFGHSFSFETVMSSPDKIEFLKKARQQNYRTYLYYIATDEPEINISRVNRRVKTGGHDVPKHKIISRYYRSLDLLTEAVKYSNRAYIFDNSGKKSFLIAEITNAETLEIKTDSLPLWFKNYFLDKIR